jgi:hypothetical protein
MTNNLRNFCCLLLTLFLGNSIVQAQVANDICLTAEPFPTLFQNVQTCVDGNNIGANGELPYLNQGYCNGGTTAPSAAADVWYSFVAVGNRLYIDFVSDMNNVTLSFYEGDCNALIGRDCIMNETSGNVTYQFSPVDPGTVYYIQVSGNSTVETGEFSLCLTNEEITENICINNQSLFLDPLPSLGTFGPGQMVSFCVNVEGYNQNAADWLHGYVPVFGNGWDLTTLVPYPPAACDGQGEWAWYESVTGTSGVAVGPQGPGFFYDSGSGGPFDGDPGNNFGDNSSGSACNWLFCFDITTVTSAPAGTDFLDLSIEFLNFSDSETGSWNATGSPCPNDPNLLFKALLQFCDSPILEPTNPTCANSDGGSITATGIGTGPFTFVWSTGFTETGEFSTLSGLSAGFYSVFSTDADGCSQGASVTLVEESTGLNLNIPVSVGGCSGCEASGSNPVAINILDQSGALVSEQFITACPSIISVCLPNDQSFSLQYGSQIITDAIVNGVLTDDVFSFITGTPSNPGDVSNDQQILCYPNSSDVTASGEVLQDGHVLGYVLHSNSGTSLGDVLATNADAGTFSINSAATIQYNTVYYVSSVAGPEGATIDGMPDLDNACTQVADGTPVVFLSPVELLVNTSCDWQVTGDLSVFVFASGGLPAFDNSTSYNINGTNLTINNSNSGTTIINEGQGEHSYTYTATDALGCSASHSNTFVCYKTPIELLSFEGKAQANGNLLTWETATETDNHYFTIMRSTDGASYKEIGKINGAGTTLSRQSYSLLDAEAPVMAYYRLLQTDYNGNVTEAATIIVRRTASNQFEVLQVNPIPSNDFVQVQYALPATSTIALSLYNSMGQLIHKTQHNGDAGLNTFNLDLSSYDAGVYMLLLNNGNDSQISRIVKN